MSRYRNAGNETIYFRDDAPGKHEVKPGESFDVVGDQHIPYVTSMPGVEDATVEELVETAKEAGIQVPSRARKADIAKALDEATPESIAAGFNETGG